MSTTIPPHNSQVGDPGHPGLHNNIADVLSLYAQALAQQAGSAVTTDTAMISAIQAQVNVPGGYGAVPGLQYLTGGGSITTATITTAAAAGFTGIYLDPRFVWNMSGVVFTGISNFTVESRMTGSIGWTGNVIYNTSGYITTGSGTDGIQIYGTTTQGIVFRNLAFVGSNTNAVIHYGGGQRRCRMEDCFAYNTSSATGAYAIVYDTQLTSQNSEDNSFFTCDFAGAYAAIGLGINNISQSANDTLWTDIATHGGTYSIRCVDGGGHSFINYYDRSNPTGATVYNTGGILYFYGGEDQNTNAPSFRVSSTGQVITINRVITLTANGVGALVDGGKFVFKGYGRASGAFQISSSGIVDFSDASTNPGGSWAVTGSSGTLFLSPAYLNGAGPDVTGWTGTTSYSTNGPFVLLEQRGNTVTSTTTITWTPPAVNVRFRLSLWIRVTTAGTSTVPALTYTGYSGGAFSATLPMWFYNSAATAPTYLCASTGDYSAIFYGDTNSASVPVVLTITPTGSTYRYSYVLEQIP